MRAIRGSITIFMALIMMTFLILCLVLIEGCRVYFLRVTAQQAMELAEFSALSEYQKELFEHYGLFFLDLDYQQGREQPEILERRLQEYFYKNIEEVHTENVKIKNICRATDGKGSSFFQQAVEVMKVQTGYKFIEELIGNLGNTSLEEMDLGEILEKSQSTAGGILGDLQDDEKKPGFSVSVPDISFPSVKALREAVFGDETGLSEKSIHLDERILKRELSKGTGKEESSSFTDMELFHQYIFNHFGYYGANNSDVWNSSLEYQLEYIISGKERDLDNLENIMWRIFLLRAGGNYLFYHQDSSKYEKTQAEALALVGFLGNSALTRAVTEIILISQAVEDGILETRKVFGGEKVPLYEKGSFSGVLLGYEEYLYLFLKVQEGEEKTYRCMDLVEMEVREKSGYEKFRMDHCTDQFDVQWDYQFSSLFHKLGYFTNGIYKNEISRKVFYEN